MLFRSIMGSIIKRILSLFRRVPSNALVLTPRERSLLIAVLVRSTSRLGEINTTFADAFNPDFVFLDMKRQPLFTCDEVNALTKRVYDVDHERSDGEVLQPMYPA